MTAGIFDTQLISYAIAGNFDLPANAHVSSTCAQELLLMQTDRHDRNRYYIPVLGRHPFQALTPKLVREHFSARANMQPFKRSTDKLILDFSGDYPTVVEHSHLAVAHAINDGRRELLEAFASAVPPQSRKAVVRRIRFLLDREVQCVPLTMRAAESSQVLLAEFVRTRNVKSRFRNSLNDLLHLAIAEQSGLVMHTRDGELAGFAHERFSAPVAHPGPGQFAVDFSDEEPSARRTMRESGGYINRPWSVRGGG
jgi:hypothetical protein